MGDPPIASNSWLGYFMEKPLLKWMITRGTPISSSLRSETSPCLLGKSS